MKAAILGMGAMGEVHRQVYESLGIGFRTYDPKDAPPEYEDEIIEWADIVSICSPDNFHLDQLIRARRLDKIVFCEKPICHTGKEFQAMECCLRPGKVGMNFPLRWHKPFTEAKQRIPELGEIYLIEADYEYGRLHKMVDGWRGDLDYDIVMGGGLHMIDVVGWLTGFDDLGLYQRFDSGLLCSLAVGRGGRGVFKLTCDFGGSKNHARRLRICGTKDSLYIDDREPTDKGRALREFLYYLSARDSVTDIPTSDEILRVHEIGLGL